MNSSLQIAHVAGTLALLAGSATGKNVWPSAPGQTVSIRLYDRAQAPAAVLHSATEETTRLFRAAGIQTLWEEPSAESLEDQGTDMTASAFRRPNERPYLVIRLIRHPPDTVFPGALGYSLPFAHHGAHVLIFYDRVAALTQRENTATDVILGHAMAHEIAHVLLGATEHSTGGLMQCCWTAASWHLASEGLLAFRREEIERMHAGLRRFQCPGPIRQRELVLTSSARSQ
jgi:hypothetical protein